MLTTLEFLTAIFVFLLALVVCPLAWVALFVWSARRHRVAEVQRIISEAAKPRC